MELTSTLVGERGRLASLGAEHGEVCLLGVPGAEQWEVTVGLRRSAHGVFWPAMLAVRSRPEEFTEVTARAVRKLWVSDNGNRPLDRLLAVTVAGATLGFNVARDLNADWTKRRRGGDSLAFSRLVAMIYTEAVASGLPPRRVVAAVWGRTLECADDWISEARRHRTLGLDPRAFRPGRPRFAVLDLAVPRPEALRSRSSSGVFATSYGARIPHVPGYPGWRCRVELLWGKDKKDGEDRRVRCRGLVIEPAERGLDVVVNSGLLGSLPIADMIAHGRAVGQGASLVSMARLLTGPLHTSRGDEHARQVAAVYQLALSQGCPPRKLISEVWNQPSRTVGTWIRKARDMGVLPEDMRWSPALSKHGLRRRPSVSGSSGTQRGPPVYRHRPLARRTAGLLRRHLGGAGVPSRGRRG